MGCNLEVGAGVGSLLMDRRGSAGAALPATAVSVPSGARMESSAAGIDTSPGYVADFTWMAWLRIDSLPQQYVSWLTLQSSTFPGGSTSYMFFGWDSLAGEGYNTRGMAVYGPGGSHSLTLLPALGTWFHAAITKTGRIVRMYLNGSICTLDTTGTSVDVGIDGYDAIDIVRVCNETGGGQDFVGGIRAVATANSALSQAQIAAAMLKSTPLPAGISSWRLTGPADLVDSVGGYNQTAFGTLGTTTGPAGITQL